ncbi:hypothetical protein BLNAU_23644 [Blattamonas nauphoetae]|uniref:Uncharacterized protein n=1 Tax=Blattamonas nauphoetae TaxID=2049346 RepID=A0ABQ9WTS8_9EUKA|nr:hypothetical protein BLNAU_23644 [Blattamonas nauphoetae]
MDLAVQHRKHAHFGCDPQNNPNHPLLVCPLAVLPTERHPKDGTTDAQKSRQRLHQLNRAARVPVAPLIVLVAVCLSTFQGTHSNEAPSPQNTVPADHHQDSLAGG